MENKRGQCSIFESLKRLNNMKLRLSGNSQKYFLELRRMVDSGNKDTDVSNTPVTKTIKVDKVIQKNSISNFKKIKKAILDSQRSSPMKEAEEELSRVEKRPRREWESQATSRPQTEQVKQIITQIEKLCKTQTCKSGVSEPLSVPCPLSNGFQIVCQECQSYLE